MLYAQSTNRTFASGGVPNGSLILVSVVRAGGLDPEALSLEIDVRVIVRLGTLFTLAVAMLMWSPVSHAGASVPSGPGYWLGAGDGGVFAFGSAPFLGSATQRCTLECFGFGATADGKGYWVVDYFSATDAADSNLYGFGSAVDVHIPNAPGDATAVASTPSSRGGWILYGRSGTVVPFGDATFFGDGSALTPCCGTWPPFGSAIDYFSGIASTPDGGGYWLVGIDGGVFAYGDATFYGSMGGHRPNEPVDGIARTSDGHGYWLVSYDGGIFSFGDARFSGSMGGKPLNALMIGIAADPGSPGYWTVAQDGGVFAFGGAPFLGSMAGPTVSGGFFGIAASG